MAPSAAKLFPARDLGFARAVADLAYCNPFMPQRIDLERRALGESFVEQESDWNLRGEILGDHPNVEAITTRTQRLLEQARAKLIQQSEKGPTIPPDDDQLTLYVDLSLVVLYHRYRDALLDAMHLVQRPKAGHLPKVAMYSDFERDASHLFGPIAQAIATGANGPGGPQSNSLIPVEPEGIAHLFACFFQVKRAFRHIFRHVFGQSVPAARFRAAIWQSIFTHDARRYRRVLFNRMADITTLVVGESGTGKEVAARAIGLSRYIPFDHDTGTFVEHYEQSFSAVNLSALSPTLIESELFGHCRGAFTGALSDRAGWLESCPALGTVFLDEIGDLHPSIQVKLLRVLQTRTFERIGDTKQRRFDGKIIAATNRDVYALIQQGHIRQDFYYRICSDTVHSPTLREQLDDRPDDLEGLVSYLAARLIGEQESRPLVEETIDYISTSMPPDYGWPGNIRELDQCVRNVLIRGEYEPAAQWTTPRTPDNDAGHDAEQVTDGGSGGRDSVSEMMQQMKAGRLSVDELTNQYCTLVYAQCGSYQEAGRRLGLDRRTVKERIDHALLEQLQSDTS
ncbi:MAG: sigma-54-dependent Fis family transcriptional regulator [Planctomycetes bacterium]|nr:sigma-54-dependent Fis family transcriptional regulator [Planctomycetota bacterium]NOG55675.1 sigma-54-dependent Fis family transcriptional regulator [Planctomycetota bacterium]